jgi:hypothetical protein
LVERNLSRRSDLSDAGDWTGQESRHGDYNAFYTHTLLLTVEAWK